MKKTPLVICLLLILSALFAFHVQKSVLLRLNLQEGFSYLYKATYTQNTTTHIAGQAAHTKKNMESAMNLKVAQKDNEGSMLLEARYNYLIYNISTKDQKTTIDSRKTTSDADKQLHSFINTMQRNPIVIKANSRDKVLDIRGMEKLRNAAGGVSNSTLQKILDKILKESTFKYNITKLGVFPKDPVSIGSQWDRTISMHNLISLTVHTTYTVINIQPKKVLVTVTSNISSTTDTAIFHGISVPANVGGTQTGTYTIDRSTGLISEGNLTQNMTVTMSVMSQQIKVNIDGEYNIEMKPVK